MKSSFKNWLATAFALVALTITAQAQTASDNYLDIANYETIDESGWNGTNYVDKLYEYTEYEEEGKAWLTLSMFGAKTGTEIAAYNLEHTQKWIGIKGGSEGYVEWNK